MTDTGPGEEQTRADCSRNRAIESRDNCSYSADVDHSTSGTYYEAPDFGLSPAQRMTRSINSHHDKCLPDRARSESVNLQAKANTSRIPPQTAAQARPASQDEEHSVREGNGATLGRRHDELRTTLFHVRCHRWIWIGYYVYSIYLTVMSELQSYPDNVDMTIHGFALGLIMIAFGIWLEGVRASWPEDSHAQFSTALWRKILWWILLVLRLGLVCLGPISHIPTLPKWVKDAIFWVSIITSCLGIPRQLLSQWLEFSRRLERIGSGTRRGGDIEMQDANILGH